jgi:DNA-directed RNA polymerase, mitochondrial
MKNLAAAGTTITASPDQAKRLRTADAELNNLLTISETGESSIDEKEVTVGSIMDALDAGSQPKRKKKSAKATSDDAEAESAAEECEDEVNELDAANARLLGKFVDLIDLMPPLPKKGDFDVETIKGSQYFFS